MSVRPSIVTNEEKHNEVEGSCEGEPVVRNKPQPLVVLSERSWNVKPNEYNSIMQGIKEFEAGNTAAPFSFATRQLYCWIYTKNVEHACNLWQNCRQSIEITTSKYWYALWK